MALKTLLVLLLLAVAFNTQGSRALTPGKIAQGGFNLGKIASYFGFGGEDDCEDCDSDKQQIQNKESDEDYEIDANDKALIKKLLYGLKYERRIKRKSKSCNKPLSRQFFQKVIADCVKEVVRKTNCNALIPVDRAYLEKGIKQIQTVYDNFELTLVAKFSVVKQALNDITTPSFNKKDIEDRIEEIIKTSLLQVKPSIEYIQKNDRIYTDKVKSVREIINENIIKFTNSILTSRCLSVRKSSTAFCKCVEPIYRRFTCNLKKELNAADSLSKSIDAVRGEATLDVNILIGKMLNSAEINANKILNDIADLVIIDPQINTEEFLKNTANGVLKQLESVINTLNNVCKKISNDLNEEINNALSKKLGKVVETFQPLIDALNYFPDENCSLINITAVKETTQKYINETSENIKNIFSRLCFLKIIQVENERQALENRSRDLLKEYSAENIDTKCKKYNPNVYIYCVNAAYKGLQVTVNALRGNTKELHAKLVNISSSEELKIFNEKSDTILEAVAKYVKNKEEKINQLAEIPKQNNEFITASIKKYQEIIEEKVNSLANCKIQQALNETNENFENTSIKFEADLRTAISSLSGKDWDSKDEAFIQEFVTALNNKVNEYRNNLNEYEDYANALVNKLVYVASQYSAESLKATCSKSYCNAKDLAACVNAEFGKLDKEIEKTVDELTKLLEKIENTKIEAETNISENGNKLLEEAKNTYNETIKDRNSPEESAAVVSKCLDFIEKKAQDEILPKLEELFGLSKGISEYIQTFDQKIKNLDAIILEAVADLDNLIALYPKEADKYKQQKEDFNALQQQAKNNIQNNIALSTDNANNFEIKVDDLQMALLAKLAENNAEKLNKICENVYPSKSKFTLCIETECENIKNTLKEVEEEVSELDKVGNSIIENGKTEIKKSVEEESSKVEEAAKKIKEEFNLNREPDDNNETTSAQRLAECTDSVNQRIKESLNVLIDEVLAIYEDLSAGLKDSTAGLNEKLQATFKTEIDALDYVTSINSKDTAKFAAQKASINASIDDAIKRINSIIAENLNSFSSILNRVNQIKAELTASQSEFVKNLNKSCEAVYSSKKNYSKCIDEQCTKFNKYLNETEETLKKLVDEANVLYVGNFNNVTSSVESEISKAEDKANKDIVTLFKENNVTEETLINMAASELSKYNVTPYYNNLKLINERAVELKNREISTNKTAYDIFGRLLNSLSLHQTVTYVICPKVPISNEVKYANSLIIDTRNAVVLTSPSQLAYINEQLNFSTYYENLLKNEIQLLQPDSIKADCNGVLSDSVKLFQCLKNKVNRFGNEFTNAGATVRIEAQDATAELNNRTNILYNWRDNDVGGKYAKVATELQPIAESIYTGACNATKDKLLDFAQTQIDNRYNRLKPIIDNLAQNVSTAADLAKSRDYKNIVDINSKLGNTMDWYKKALEDAKKKNPSYVTQDKINETQKIIGYGVGKFDKFINEIPQNASIAKANASQLVSEVLELYKTTDKKAAEAKCYKEDVAYRYSSFIQCNNGFAYDFEQGVVAKQKKLEEAASKLSEVNNKNGTTVVNNFADQLEKELITRSAVLSIQIYIDNNIEIPDYLKPYLTNKCLASGPKPAECIITT